MNNKNQPMGYEIEFLGANNEPLAYCKAEMSINGLPTSESPWQADENGRIVFPPSLVEQEGKELRIKVVFWNEQYPKTEHSEIPEFTWIKGKRLVRLRAYNIYEIKPRTIPNEKGEPETYKRPYHIVEPGDTWEVIEKEAGVNRYALIWENGLDEATPLSSLAGQKIYFPKGTRKQKTTTKPTSTKTTPSSESKQSESKASTNNKSIDNKKKSIPVAEKKVEEKTKAKPTVEDKKEKEQVIQERSESNGKPVDIIDTEKNEFDWFETPLVKLIVSKESKGSFNAYNITGWNSKGKNVVYESKFYPTERYHLEKMTLAEIRKEQNTYIGENKKHLFAVGIFQIIPDTLFGKGVDDGLINWISKYKKIDENSQLFDEKFQRLTPLYFWEKKRSTIGEYFKGTSTEIEAAYAVSKEWASAATPKGLPVAKKKNQINARISDGTISFYDSDGLNKAHYSAEVTMKALRETKGMIEAAGGYDLVKEQTLSSFVK
ncbi:hypothetical protein [Haemophilus parainfluenzae]|uniref:hypothetical protein n=1 Tax=Haemophilus parainfluenzae TaxID=729 RepID=UPI001F07FF60|nr:hypothetical protein [Haemophilus parainfluenzae]